MTKPDILIPFHTTFEGKYKLEAVDANGNRRLLGEFPNLITNLGLDMMAEGLNWNRYVSVGSGNATPNVLDTTLQSYVNSTTSTIYTNIFTQSSPPYYGSGVATWQFPIGSFPSGANLSEVGVGASPGGVNLFSRALILDNLGNPTTITILATEALDITYQLNQYPPLIDLTGSVVISGVTYNWTSRALAVTNLSWSPLVPGGDAQGIFNIECYSDASLADITANSPNGTYNGGPDSGSNAVYTPGSYYVDSTWGWSLAASNNADGISGFAFACGQSYEHLGRYQMVLDTPIPKNGTNVLSLGFRVSWGRT